eukprot:14308387-Heterocapsa_arctica.AAC.1
MPALASQRECVAESLRQVRRSQSVDRPEITTDTKQRWHRAEGPFKVQALGSNRERTAADMS